MICTRRWSLIATGLLFAAAVVQAQEPTPPRELQLLAPFKQDLQNALRTGLAEGPVEAISACRLRAPEIAKALSRDDVRVGRASHRLRNPANAAPEWVAPILEGYVAHPTDRTPRTANLPNGRSGYVEPILLQPLCLGCHGNDLSPEVASRIEELYPHDAAVGFEVGDLRGVFWLEYRKAE